MFVQLHNFKFYATKLRWFGAVQKQKTVSG
jgi:hypothetical protein